MKRILFGGCLFIIILASLPITAIGLFYAEEDWRGAHDWAVYQHELVAKGESLDLRQIIPPGRPEDDLSTKPLFAELYKPAGKNSSIVPRLRQITVNLDSADSVVRPKGTSIYKGQPFDLTAWQDFYAQVEDKDPADLKETPPQTILRVLSRFDPDLKELQSEVADPDVSFHLNYDDPPKTRFTSATPLISIVRVLQLKGVAHLDNLQPDQAEQDLLSSERLNRPLTHGYFLIGIIVAEGMQAMDDSLVWEGVRRHAWDQKQLEAIDGSLAQIDFLTLAKLTFRMERTIVAQEFIDHPDDAMRIKLLIPFAQNADEYSLLPYFRLRPSGWHDEDCTVCVKTMQLPIEAIYPSNGTMNATVFDVLSKHLKPNSFRAFYVPFWEFTSIFSDGYGVGIAKAETYRRMARISCRLEEYRIAHNGQYPDSLDQLPDLPPHLNQEVLSTQPMHYARKGDGYSLYSVGWDRIDHGGKQMPSQDGDWVWPGP